jgi:hypothetical protein
VPLELNGPWAKIDRATEHLKTLEFGCRLFLHMKPYHLTAEFEPDVGYHVVRIRVRRQVPLELSMVVGELVHSLRSALDQAVWLLACRSNPVETLWPEKIDRKIAFPFAEQRKTFQTHGLMAYIADDAKAVLDKAQPYQGTDRPMALADVNRLWTRPASGDSMLRGTPAARRSAIGANGARTSDVPRSVAGRPRQA